MFVHNFSVPKKEAFAIVASLRCMDYLVSEHNLAIFRDNARLGYLFDPYGRNTGISRHTASKLVRCAIVA